MDTLENASQFKPEQIKAIRFLAAGKVDINGKKWTIEEFCEKVLKIHYTTFYDWQNKPAFRQAVLDETMGRVQQFVPDMVRAQVHKAIKKQDTPAFMAIMRQSGVLKSDKQDINQSGELNVTINTINYKDVEVG